MNALDVLREEIYKIQRSKGHKEITKLDKRIYLFLGPTNPRS